MPFGSLIDSRAGICVSPPSYSHPSYSPPLPSYKHTPLPPRKSKKFQEEKQSNKN